MFAEFYYEYYCKARFYEHKDTNYNNTDTTFKPQDDRSRHDLKKEIRESQQSLGYHQLQS